MYFDNTKWIITDKELTVLADYIINNNSTIRKTAELIGMPKTTLHQIIHSRLPNIDFNKYEELQKTLDNNYKQKHLRGGEATRQKFLKPKKE